MLIYKVFVFDKICSSDSLINVASYFYELEEVCQL